MIRVIYTLLILAIGVTACGQSDTEPRQMEGDVPSGIHFISVSAGGYHACGVRSDQTVSCRGHDFDGEASPPEWKFSSVSAGYFNTCGVTVDGSVFCWGRGL